MNIVGADAPLVLFIRFATITLPTGTVLPCAENHTGGHRPWSQRHTSVFLGEAASDCGCAVFDRKSSSAALCVKRLRTRAIRYEWTRRQAHQKDHEGSSGFRCDCRNPMYLSDAVGRRTGGRVCWGRFGHAEHPLRRSPYTTLPGWGRKPSGRPAVALT